MVGSGPKIQVEIDACGYHKNEINLTVATCCAKLETAARHCLMHCTAAQPRTLEGTVAATQSQHVWMSGIRCCWPGCLELTE